MHITTSALLASLLLLCPLQTLADGSASTPDKPCTIHSPNTGMYFDLNTISVLPPGARDGQKSHFEERETSWHAKGHDYPANFTINMCAPVIEELQDVVGVDKERWQNVSAFYEMDGQNYSIGQQASSLLFRGRKLVLNYTDGSPCPAPDEPKLFRRKVVDGDDEGDEGDKEGDDEDDKDDKDDKDKDEDEDKDKDKDKDGNDGDGDDDGEKKKPSEGGRRKSTLMSFLCDRELATPAVSFVGSLDSCTYFFEVRTSAACGGVAASTDGGLGPAGVFGIIAIVALAVYLIGGCAYQRTVMHQRGWRQLPNYSMWNNALGFLWDISIIIFSSLTNCLKCNGLRSRSGHLHLPGGTRAGDTDTGRRGLVGAIGGRGFGGSIGGSRGQRRNLDEENRLIDQLDEEWDD